jgi:lysophospholipase L1-like esterase
MGDSIMAGYSTTQNYLSGMVRACAANGVSFMMGACGGDFAINETDDRLSRSRNQLLADCDAILMNYGTNDLYNNSSTVAATQAALLAIWARYGRYSLPIFQSTLIPRVSGTMTSTTTQTTLAAEANRQALNAWLRAPITAGAGQSAMYDAGGSLTGIFEFAGALETNLANATPSITNPNTGGLWYCGPANNTAYSNDGVHPNDTGAIYMIPSVPLNRIGHFQSINVATT